MRTIRVHLALAAALVLGAAGTARAQGLGERGQLSLAADRLFGLYMGERDVDIGPRDIEVDFGIFGLAWTGETSPLNRPRLAFDYFVTDGLSIGGALGFYVADDDDDDDDDEDDGSGLILAPRVGYLISLGRVVGFWPRGGFTFYTIDDHPVDQSQLALTLEGIFVIALADHFAFDLGPTIDVGFTGERGSFDMTEWSIGIAMGILGWVDL